MSPETTPLPSIPSTSANSDSRVGVTVITGFLGSGKSTLIRRILTEDHGLRLVVVENEFGANTSVEEAIVTQGVGPAALEQFIELPNGCICCAAQDDLTDALSRLLRIRGDPIDHILVEASGLADPGPIAASFWVDDELETGLVLDAVVTVADAVNIEGYLSDGGGRSEKAAITQKQLAVADLVLLNKIDLVTGRAEILQSETVAQLDMLIRSAGCSARVIPTTKCDIALSELLNLRAYDNQTSELALTTSAPTKFLGHAHPDGVNVGSVTITFEDAIFEGSLLDRVLGELLWEKENEAHGTGAASREIWRMKALVSVVGENCKRIYQSVDTLFDHSPSNVAVGDEDTTSRFIFIGRALKSNQLKSCIERAIIKTTDTEMDVK